MEDLRVDKPKTNYSESSEPSESSSNSASIESNNLLFFILYLHYSR